MIQITVPSGELFDEKTSALTSTKEQVLQLEHSLVSLSRWESMWCKPFLTKTSKTVAESVDYIRCMTVTQNVDPNVYLFITQENMRLVASYIELPMTATTFVKDNQNITNHEVITSEIIYYWMIALTIPVQFEKWHLNRLLTLINVCNLKNQPPKKMSNKDLLARNRDLNAIRRSQLHTEG